MKDFNTTEPIDDQIPINGVESITAMAKALVSRHGITFVEAMLVISEHRIASGWIQLQSSEIGKRHPKQSETTVAPEKIGTKENKKSNRNSLKLRSLASNNTSGCTGVSRATGSEKWIAQIGRKGKVIYLGSYVEYWDAMSARKSAEHEYGFYS